MKKRIRHAAVFIPLVLLFLSATQAFADSDGKAAKSVDAGSQDSHPVIHSKWNTNFYGFVEFDMIGDSTRSFNDAAGNAVIARPDSFAGKHGRLTFGARNSRIGFKLNAPEFDGIKTSAILEMDFLGNQPPNATESAFFTNPTFRFRHLALKMETPVVDILAGQYWQLFGWQPYFHPNTVGIQGVPGQIYSRSPQLRATHMFKVDPVSIEVAVAAARPPQRDSMTPDGQAGVRLALNSIKGLHTAGSTGTAVDSASIGLSGDVRRFSLPDFSASPSSNASKTGWGIDVDALIPIIPASLDSRGNALTFTGSFVRGEGIADLYTGLTGGLSFPALPNPGNASPAPTYTPNVDNGLVTFDSTGALKTIGWQSYILGLQYYLPSSGKVWVSANYSRMTSSNASSLASSPKTTFNQSRWADANIFWDITPSVRAGVEYAWFHQNYIDGTKGNDHRGQLSFFYLF